MLMIFHLVFSTRRHTYICSQQQYLPHFSSSFYSVHITLGFHFFLFHSYSSSTPHSSLSTKNMNIANRKREEETPCCYFHPKQAVIGVCPLCLNERLLIVAAKQGHHHHHSSTASHQIRLQSSTHRKQPSSASIHKIFAFGSLFSRPESQQLKSHNYDYDASPSPEGKSFFYTLLCRSQILLIYSCCTLLPLCL